MNKRITVSTKEGPLDSRYTEYVNGVSFVFPIKITWDGSYLGTISELDILGKSKFLGKEIWKLSFCDCFVIVKSSINQLACINDEIMELLGLGKIGTHSIRYKNSFYILYRCYETDNILENNDPFLSEETKYDVRKIIVLKNRLGWSTFKEKNIILRWDNIKNRYCAFSYHENTVGSFKSKIMTDKLYNKWISEFQNENNIFLDILSSMSKSKGGNGSLIGDTFILIGKIEDCIMRIEPDLIFIINDMKKRIMEVC